MKQRILSVVLNPYVISAFIAGLIILLSPDYLSKYKINEVGQELIRLGSIISYEDLDNDGKSEKIVLQDNNIGNASYLLYKSNGDFVDQFNLDSKFCLTKSAWFQDVNEDGIKEICIITQSQDSAFLNIHDHSNKDGLISKKVFVDTIHNYKGEYRFRTNKSLKINDQIARDDEIIFSLMAGYSGYPRNLYQYNIFNDSILKSPHLTNSAGITDALDLDGDLKNEILITNVAPGNVLDSLFTKRSDYSTWLTVLDYNLQFKFEPIEFKALGSIQLLPFNANGEVKLVGCFRSRENDKIPSKLIVLSVEGVIEKEFILPNSNYQYLYKINENSFAFSNRFNGEIQIFDSSLEFLESYKIEPNSTINLVDVDNNGIKEWVVFNVIGNEISIYDKNFRNKVVFPLEDNQIDQDFISEGIKHLNNNESQLYFQRGRVNTLISYFKNPLYSLKYLIYLGIYIFVLGMVLLIAKGQRIQHENKQLIENEISELQIKAVKNQVDPHFVFNAINTISEMTLMDNKLEADKFITKFSRFMRDTLASSDKISTTLKEELDYTENFIKLQQVRFQNNFDYKIVLDLNTDHKTIIPKHVFFCYVENAIKHGLALKENGMLEIGTITKGDKLLLYIQDNGGGIRKLDKPRKDSTGNGLLIMERVFELYEKLFKIKIKHKMTEVMSVENQIEGVRVDIEIELPKKR